MYEHPTQCLGLRERTKKQREALGDAGEEHRVLNTSKQICDIYTYIYIYTYYNDYTNSSSNNTNYEHRGARGCR